MMRYSVVKGLIESNLMNLIINGFRGSARFLRFLFVF